MVADSIEYLRSQGRRVFFDAEHFFDGYRSNPDFARAVLSAAHESGAERLVLCDTRAAADPPEAAQLRLELADRALAEGVYGGDDAKALAELSADDLGWSLQRIHSASHETAVLDRHQPVATRVDQASWPAAHDPLRPAVDRALALGSGHNPDHGDSAPHRRVPDRVRVGVVG